MPSTRAVIFDMDGLMVDTEPISRAAWEAALRPFGRILTDEVYDQMVGYRIDESVQILLAALPLPISAPELVARKQALMARLLAGDIPVMPGLYTLQAALARRRLPWGVATSSPRAQAEQILARLGLAAACRALAGGDEAARGKPAPDIYYLAARRLGVAPGACLALEDSLAGCQAAVAAGMRTVAVPNPGAATAAADFGIAQHVYPTLDAVAADLDRLLGPG
jgi:HAD superfamily hydrolase (TIGR01509 family)